MPDKRIIVVGAGPGGLTSAMILARRGYRVTVYEKQPELGGRNAALKKNGFTWDRGPTFLMMKFFLENVFRLAGASIDEQLKIMRLDPMYKLSFPDREFISFSDPQKMEAELQRHFPGEVEGLRRFYRKEKRRFEKMLPGMQRPYSDLASMISPSLLTTMPYMSIGKSLYDQLGEYFSHEQLRLAFTFQAKYLGMSPWDCPAAFTIIPWSEHAQGVYHIAGGLNAISQAMAGVAAHNGAEIHTDCPVEKVLVNNGKATGVQLRDGHREEADFVVINADFGHAMDSLFDPGIIRKYAPSRLLKKKFSCSTFMIYLGLDTIYDEPHHNVLFARDYKKNIEETTLGARLSEDISFYVQNATVLDPSLAPPGHSALYVLVPVPNTQAPISWDQETTEAFAEKVLTGVRQRTSMNDLTAHITEKVILTPEGWRDEHDIFLGATFNLSHTIRQMLYFRPHNRFEEVENVYLVGGGTHPGSGLPTIYESARISSEMISRES